MIVAFDLDDTLYPEETFVRSGFEAVAHALERRWGVDQGEAFELMWDSLERDGRGRQFDAVVERLGLAGRQPVAELVRTYRHHRPSISLPPRSRAVLQALAPRPLYVVTDGHKVVQQRKIDALGIAPLLRHAYITHRYGIRHRKPSPRVFELMLRRERCAAREVVYVGDDPSKDFRSLRPLGIRTIRLLTGRHAGVTVPAAEDAELTLPGIDGVPAAVAEIEAGP
ncbi:MAG: HAD family hydrolase [Thermoleophilaceae bacterium]